MNGTKQMATPTIPKLQNPCHFSALQPLLSTYYSTAQVKSLLALALLFWQKPTFSDTQIGDSPHLYREFARPKGESLAPLIRESLASGEARFLVRDAFYTGPSEKMFNCADLADVYRGWIKQGIPGAWVVRSTAPNRDRFIEAWNTIIPKEFILSYDYLTVKSMFQERARAAMGWLTLREDLGDPLYHELKMILDSEWFSHSHVYSVLNQPNLVNPEWTQRFGLIDEAAYADFFDAGMAALNVPSTAEEETNREAEKATEHIHHVMSEAFKTVDVGELRLLHLLTFEEIMEIRSRGAFLLDMIRIMDARRELTDRDLTELALGLASYWRVVCDEIDRRHRGATRTKTKLGLIVSQQSVLPIEETVEGLSIVLSGGLARLLTGGPEGQTGLIHKIVDRVSLKFLLTGETPELKHMREVLSRNAVLTARTRA